MGLEAAALEGQSLARWESAQLSIDVPILISWRAIFSIIEILAYGLSYVTLVRGGMEVLRLCHTSAIGVAYLVAGRIIGVMGEVQISSSCRVTKIGSGGPEVAV